MGQIQWTVSLVLIALFSIAIIGFVQNFALDNDAPINLANDPEISNLYSSTTGNISGFNADAESTYTSIVNSSIASEGFTTQSAGQFAITPTNIVSIISQTLRTGYVKIFGNGSGFGIFMTTFLGLIVFITGLFLWKTWAGRTPE